MTSVKAVKMSFIVRNNSQSWRHSPRLSHFTNQLIYGMSDSWIQTFLCLLLIALFTSKTNTCTNHRLNIKSSLNHKNLSCQEKSHCFIMQKNVVVGFSWYLCFQLLTSCNSLRWLFWLGGCEATLQVAMAAKILFLVTLELPNLLANVKILSPNGHW